MRVMKSLRPHWIDSRLVLLGRGAEVPDFLLYRGWWARLSNYDTNKVQYGQYAWIVINVSRDALPPT